MFYLILQYFPQTVILSLVQYPDVAKMLGHLPETNDKHYNYDVTPDKIKADCLKEMYQTFQKVA